MSLSLLYEYFWLFLGMGASGFLAYQLIHNLFPDQQLLEAQQRLGVEFASRQYKHWSLAMLSPFYRLLVPRIQQIKMPDYRRKMKLKFVAAGIDDQFDPDEFVGLKVIASIMACFLGLLFLMQFGSSPSLLKALTLLVGGFFIPDYAVYDLLKRRQKAILRQLPSVLDLLTLSVEAAGLDFMAAISRVIYFAKDGPLKEEFSQMLKELQLGSGRAEALRHLADRVQLAELSSFATILIQADQMGTPIGPVLRAQSDQLRSERFQKAEREGAKATQKLLIPLIVFIFPSVFIVILGPMICDIVYNQPWFQNIFGG